MQWLLNWSMICNLMNILVAMCWRCGITHYARVCVVANNAVMARMAPGCYASFQLQLCCCNGGKAFLCHDHNNCAVTVEDYSYVVTAWHLLLQMTWHSSPRMCTWNWSYNMVLSTTSVGSVYIGSGGRGGECAGGGECVSSVLQHHCLPSENTCLARANSSGQATWQMHVWPELNISREC